MKGRHFTKQRMELDKLDESREFRSKKQKKQEYRKYEITELFAILWRAVKMKIRVPAISRVLSVPTL